MKANSRYEIKNRTKIMIYGKKEVPLSEGIHVQVDLASGHPTEMQLPRGSSSSENNKRKEHKNSTILF